MSKKEIPNNYIIQSKWEMAIGLQKVDDLKPSKVLIELVEKNIKEEITLENVKENLVSYYESLNGDCNQKEYECDFVSLRIMEFLQKSLFYITVDFYNYTHHYLFQDVYSFAGKFREVNISKEERILNGDTVLYCDYSKIRSYLGYDFSEQRNEEFEKLSIDEKIISISNFTSDIWQVHPYLEGNTRTTAIFIIKYLLNIGFDIDYSLFKLNAKYFRDALVRSNYFNNSLNIEENNSFLIKFYENLLLGKNNNLHSKDLNVQELFNKEN